MKTIKFYKEEENWYADVPNHTKEENLMVSGADDFLETLNCFEGKGDTIYITCNGYKEELNPSNALVELERVNHNQYGATYEVNAGDLYDYTLRDVCKLWLCNVVHDIFKDHPKYIYIFDIEYK